MSCSSDEGELDDEDTIILLELRYSYIYEFS